MKKIRTRFAPSPTGYMHVGNLRTALYAYLIAKKEQGDFLLRIEDTDQERYVDGSVDVIYNTLAAVGLHHDEGPDKLGDCGPYVQSERLAIYQEYAKKLIEKKGAHYCFCSEKEVELQREQAEKEGRAFKFQDPCRFMNSEDINEKLSQNVSYVIRQTIEPIGTSSFEDAVYGKIEVDNEILDESVLLKSDGYPTYNFANVIDDHLMGITHVVRGNEYLAQTPKYNLIYKSYGWEIPEYVHLASVMKDEQHKLSKRDGDASFQDLVAKGYLPEAIINYLALLGWAPETEKELYSLEELIQAFSVKRINKSGAIFDLDKLTWMNGLYLRNKKIEDFHELCIPYYKDLKSGFDLMEISKILQQRVSVLTEITEMIDFFNDLHQYTNEMFIHKKMKTNEEVALATLTLAYQFIDTLNDYTLDNLHDGLLSLAKDNGFKNGQLLFPLRLALTGKAFTPGGAIEIANILGKEETLRRIKVSIDQLSA
jgi:glutamyl-tRNA synthetase, bacterial family